MNNHTLQQMTLENIARACGGTYVGEDTLRGSEITGAVIDSRQVEPGYLYIPIRGERVDGHRFIPDVFEKGALAVLSEEPLENPANLELLGQLDRSLNPHILPGMNTCRDQHCFSCAVSMQDSCRKPDIAICKFQFAAPLLSRLHRYIFQMKSISFSSCQQKYRRGTVVDDLFFCPDFFPDLLITGNVKKPCFLHRFNIPLRTFQTA